MPAWERSASFQEYLAHKKIDGEAWQAHAPAGYAAAELEFNAMGPRSFDQRKKFLLMDWRLAYPALAPEVRRAFRLKGSLG